MIFMKTSNIKWRMGSSVQCWNWVAEISTLLLDSVWVFRLTSTSFAKGAADSQFPWSSRRCQSRKCFFPEHSELGGSFAAPPDCPPQTRWCWHEFYPVLECLCKVRMQWRCREFGTQKIQHSVHHNHHHHHYYYHHRIEERKKTKKRKQKNVLRIQISWSSWDDI
jgi:hypothetical protein